MLLLSKTINPPSSCFHFKAVALIKVLFAHFFRFIKEWSFTGFRDLFRSFMNFSNSSWCLRVINFFFDLSAETSSTFFSAETWSAYSTSIIEWVVKLWKRRHYNIFVCLHRNFAFPSELLSWNSLKVTELI